MDDRLTSKIVSNVPKTIQTMGDVEYFFTSDGKDFTSERVASNHQDRLDAKASLEARPHWVEAEGVPWYYVKDDDDMKAFIKDFNMSQDFGQALWWDANGAGAPSVVCPLTSLYSDDHGRDVFIPGLVAMSNEAIQSLLELFP